MTMYLDLLALTSSPISLVAATKAQLHYFCNIRLYDLYKRKFGVGLPVKAIPLQAWTGPDGSRWLSLPDFKTIGT